MDATNTNKPIFFNDYILQKIMLNTYIIALPKHFTDEEKGVIISQIFDNVLLTGDKTKILVI